MTPRMVALTCVGVVLVGSGWLHAVGRDLPTTAPFDQLQVEPSTAARGFLRANRLLTSVTRQRLALSPSASQPGADVHRTLSGCLGSILRVLPQRASQDGQSVA